MYVLGKLARRYRGPLWAAAAILAALGVGLGTALWQWNVAIEQATIARRNEAIAARERDRANDNYARYQKLEDKVKLKQLEQRARALWPEGPDAADDMQSWVDAVEAWLGAMPDHREALMQLRERARKGDGAWVLPDGSEQFLHDALEELVHDLAAFTATTGTLARVRESLDWSRRVVKETVFDHEQEWREANGRIRVHPGLRRADPGTPTRSDPARSRSRLPARGVLFRPQRREAGAWR